MGRIPVCRVDARALGDFLEAYYQRKPPDILLIEWVHGDWPGSVRAAAAMARSGERLTPGRVASSRVCVLYATTIHVFHTPRFLFLLDFQSRLNFCPFFCFFFFFVSHHHLLHLAEVEICIKHVLGSSVLRFSVQKQNNNACVNTE